jgi:hypothetical protein
MKNLKKIITAISLSVICAVLSVCFLTGCGSNASLSEVESFVAKESTNNTLSKGYSFDINYFGIQGTGKIVFSEEGDMEFWINSFIKGDTVSENVLVDQYLKDGYYYYRKNKSDPYTRLEATEDLLEDFDDYIELADLNETIVGLLGELEEYDGHGLKTTKSEKNGVLEYNLSYKDKTGTLSFALKFEKTTAGYQLSSFSYDLSATDDDETVRIYIKIARFEGEIDFPEDLDTNFVDGSEDSSEVTESDQVA